ncbi:hypothetical protein DPMN_191484 [Dreissena polymorpha]|uniref:Uncharacterized protein n=1 Tax=Dreissena polymorpha TaxID=45954 RepID=A0A9D4BEN4_DREPO|nr:hypothetical protein DPMN_191484 [Dreissena polymorpha]
MSVPADTGFNDRFGIMDSGSVHGVNTIGSIVEPDMNQQNVGFVGMDPGFGGNNAGLGGEF